MDGMPHMIPPMEHGVDCRHESKEAALRSNPLFHWRSAVRIQGGAGDRRFEAHLRIFPSAKSILRKDCSCRPTLPFALARTDVDQSSTNGGGVRGVSGRPTAEVCEESRLSRRCARSLRRPKAAASGNL